MTALRSHSNELNWLHQRLGDTTKEQAGMTEASDQGTRLLVIRSVTSDVFMRLIQYMDKGEKFLLNDSSLHSKLHDKFIDCLIR